MLKKLLFATVILFAIGPATRAQESRWTEKDAAEWYAKQPWLVGSNYIPANAINELEMWQADTFDPKRIDLGLGWAIRRCIRQMWRWNTCCSLPRLTIDSTNVFR